MHPTIEIRLKALLRKAHDGLELPVPLEEKMVTDLAMQLEFDLNYMIMMELDDQHHHTYLALMTRKATESEFDVFFQGKISDLQSKIQQVLERFEDGYLNDVVSVTE